MSEGGAAPLSTLYSNEAENYHPFNYTRLVIFHILLVRLHSWGWEHAKQFGPTEYEAASLVYCGPRLAASDDGVK